MSDERTESGAADGAEPSEPEAARDNGSSATSGGSDPDESGASNGESEPGDSSDEERDSEPQPVDDAPPPAATPETKPEKAALAKPAQRSLLRGWLTLLIGALAPFLLMAADRHFTFSVPVALVGFALASFGVFDLLGSFEKTPDTLVARGVQLSTLGPRLAELGGASVLLVVVLRLAVAGVLPKPVLSAAVVVTALFFWVVIAGYRVAEELGVIDKDGPPFWKREGFWLIAISALLYLPLLGSYSLSDPWETHYGEVSREMLARDDWISLWWAQDGWFWSKPILDFWLQGVFFSLLGVRYAPDRMLSAAGEGRFPQPEWAARLPIFLLTMIAVYVLYKAVAKAAGRRAGLLSGLILISMPYFYLISHQTMTDMPYVAPLTTAAAFMLLGFNSDPEQRVRTYEVSLGKRSFALSAYHLLFTAILFCVLPQILYLLSRNITLQLSTAPHGFMFHWDSFWSGSGGGNCGLPGNEVCRQHEPVNKGVQPAFTALGLVVASGLLFWTNRNERRLQRLYFLAAWLFVAFSAMGKGAPGLVIPIFMAGVFIGATRRWKDILNMEVSGLVLLFVCVALPWYWQMFMRHGPPFTDRLLFHDMYKRAFVHVHDTNVGDDVSFRYYIWQLGYGLFPWTGLAAAGLVWWLRMREGVSRAQRELAIFMALWFVSSFGMFTITLTKFHHYVFPVVPPTAVLTGFLLDRAIGRDALPKGRGLFGYLGGMTAAALFMVYGAIRLFPGSLLGTVLDKEHPPTPGYTLGIICLLLGSAIAAVLMIRRRNADAEPSPANDSEERAANNDALMLGAIGFAAAVVVALCGRDLFTTIRGDIDGQARLMHLFTYNYRRPWPDSLNFNAVLTGFTLVAAVLCLAFIVRKLRGHAAVLFTAVALIWAAWGLDVYLFKSSPHWGQRETVMAYYQDRSDPNQPLVAYQMNWKGENFYTGNRTPAFVSSGQKFKDWIDEQKRAGVKVFYFTTEHGRIGSLKSELGNPANFKVVTTPELNNKFMLARVEF